MFFSFWQNAYLYLRTNMILMEVVCNWNGNINVISVRRECLRWRIGQSISIFVVLSCCPTKIHDSTIVFQHYLSDPVVESEILLPASTQIIKLLTVTFKNNILITCVHSRSISNSSACSSASKLSFNLNLTCPLIHSIRVSEYSSCFQQRILVWPTSMI